MKRLFALFCALALGISAWAIPLTVTWIDGKVERQKGSGWLTLKEGDIVDSVETVRLATASLVEFANGKQKIVISTAGTFALDSLTKAASAQQQKSSGTVDKLAKLVAPSKTDQAAVGGVRGDLIGDAVSKMDLQDGYEDTRKMLVDALKLNSQSKFQEAAALFGKAAKDAVGEGSLVNAATYGQACSYAAMGSNGRAILLLRKLRAAGGLPEKESLLLARLDLDSGAKDEAVAILTFAINNGSLMPEDLYLAKDMLKEAGAAK